MLAQLSATIRKSHILALLFIIITAAITGQNILLGPKTFAGQEYTHYNNYKIYTESYFNLAEGRDLYKPHPEQYWDHYKYSPTFALLMAPFAYMPDVIGLFLWNFLNVIVLILALWKLPFKSNKIRLFLFGFILIELVTSVQSSQSNALISGLIVLAFTLLEKKHMLWATLLIVLTVFIKLFGLVAFSLFIFYPNKGRAVMYSVGWTILLTILPVIVIPFSQLSFLYESWFGLLTKDHSLSLGLSVMGWLQNWFGLEFSKNMIVIPGTVVLCLPLQKYRYYDNVQFKLLYLSSVLIWVVIFNHKAESPTFIIAITGVAIWFFSQVPKIENVILLSLAGIFTILSSTDLFPQEFRESVIRAYDLKVLPCILIWFKITYDLLSFKTKPIKQIEPETGFYNA